MVAIITYDYPHLKTEQIIHGLQNNNIQIDSIYALPFVPRKAREVLFSHRPPQGLSPQPADIAAKHGIKFVRVKDKESLEIEEDLALVAIGVLIPGAVLEKTKVINCHSGIIPLTKGLDAFKWGILNDNELGVTLHYIDAAIDCGSIIEVKRTPVYKSDTLETLARRHYETELELNINFFKYLDRPCRTLSTEEMEMPSNRRMPMETEKELIALAPEYIAKHGV